MVKNKTDFDIFETNTKNFIDAQKAMNTQFQDLIADKEKKLTKLDEALSDIDSKMLLIGGAGDGGSGADMKIFEIMIHKLRKEFKNRFVTEEEVDEKINGPLNQLNTKVDQFQVSFESKLSSLITRDEVNDFVTRDELNKGLLRDRASRNIPREEAPKDDSNPKPSSIDSEAYHDLQDRVVELEDSLLALQNQIKASDEKVKKDIVQLRLNKFDYTNGRLLKDSIEKFQVRMDEVDKSVKACINKMEDEVEALLIERIKPLEEDSKGHGDIILQITQRIQRIEVKIEAINKITSTFKAKNDGLDQEKLRNAETNLKHIAREIDLIKTDITKRVEEIMKSIYFKADKTEVTALETKILDNLDDLVQSMYKKFSDKVETKENLKILDRQLKNLFDIVMNKEQVIEQNDKNTDKDEVMISRKPLGGVSCASCSKKINNLCNTQQTEYFSWSKLPFRDPTDRISRVGQGFSKILKKTTHSIAKQSRNDGHLSTTDLRKDADLHDENGKQMQTISPKNKTYSPFRAFDVAQKTARERKVKGLDVPDDDMKVEQREYQTYLPKITKAT